MAARTFIEMTSDDFRELSVELSRLSDAAKVQPFIELVFGDKDKGFVVYHETKSPTRDAALKMRIWVKGKSFDLNTTPGAATFVNDVSRL